MNYIETTEEEYWRFLKEATEIIDDYYPCRGCCGDYSHMYIFMKDNKKWKMERCSLDGVEYYYKPVLLEGEMFHI